MRCMWAARSGPLHPGGQGRELSASAAGVGPAAPRLWVPEHMALAIAAVSAGAAGLGTLCCGGRGRGRSASPRWSGVGARPRVWACTLPGVLGVSAQLLQWQPGRWGSAGWVAHLWSRGCDWAPSATRARVSGCSHGPGSRGVPTAKVAEAAQVNPGES